MEGVRSRLGRYQHGRSRPFPILRRVVVSEDFEFLDGVDRRENRDPAFIQLVVVVTVEEPIRALGSGAADGKRVGPPSRRLPAGGGDDLPQGRIRSLHGYFGGTYFNRG